MGYADTPIDPDESSLRLRHAIENRFPYPIARTFYQLRSTDDWLAEIPLLANVLGVALQHLATVALAEYLAQPEREPSLSSKLLDTFNRPLSHGTWAGVLRDTLTYLRGQGGSHFIAPLIEGYFADGSGGSAQAQRQGGEEDSGSSIKETSDALVQRRNDLLKRASGAVPNRSEAQRFKRQVMELMQLVGFLKDYQFVSARSSRTQSGVKTHSCLLHMGFHDIFEQESVQCDLDLENGYPVLLNARAHELLYLYPFYTLRDCPKAGCGATHLFHFERLDSKGIEYAFEGEHRFRDAKAGGDLQALLRGEGPGVPLRQTAKYLYLQGVDARHRHQKLPEGSRVDGRYEVVEHLRRGGMADVYKARLVGSDTMLAMKVLPFQFVSDRKMVQRFTQEATQAQELEHPNITRLIAHGDDLENHYIVMELATGWRVEDAGGKSKLALDVGELPKPVGEEAAIDIIQQTCEGLYYIHRQGIIHRDVKPGNLLLFEGRQVKLADFGIARSREAMSLTSTGLAMGTPEYMSPEQVEGAEELTPASDIYSLGVVLYELLVGVVPFKRANLVAVMNAHKSATPPLPRSINPAIPEGLQAIVMRCLEKDPAKRYRSAKALVKALIDYQKGQVIDIVGPEATPESAAPTPSTSTGPLTSTPDSTPQPASTYETSYGVGSLQADRQEQLAPLSQPQARPQSSKRYRWVLIALSMIFILIATVVWWSYRAGETKASQVDGNTPTSVLELSSLPVLQGTPVPNGASSISPNKATQVAQFARWGKGTTNSVAVSPDGRLLTVASSVGIYLYDIFTLTEIRFIDTKFSVESVAFSPDGQVLASAIYGNMVKLWRVSDGAELHALYGHSNSIQSIVFSPDGQTLASASLDHTVRLWRVSDGSLLRILEGHTDPVESVVFSPDGQVLASASWDKTIRLWHVSDGVTILILEGHTDTVNSVAFSPDGETLASASGDKSVKLWHMSDGMPFITLSETDWVTDVKFSPDGRILASASRDNVVRLWKASDGTELHTLQGWKSLAFSPDSQVVVTTPKGSNVKLWSTADGTLLSALQDIDPPHSIAFSPDSKTLASTSSGNIVGLWNASDGKLLNTLQGHTKSVSSVAFSPDGQTLASASLDNTVRLWRVLDGALFHTLVGHTNSVNSVAFSPDGRTLASASTDKTVKLWRASEAIILRTLEGHTNSVNSVAFSPDGRTIVSSSDDGTVRLWDVQNGRLLNTLHGHTGPVWGAVFSPDGQTVASVGNEGLVRLWNALDGILLRTLEGHTDSVYSVAFSPDGQVLASASYDYTVRLWRTQDGVLLHTLRGHTNVVDSVAFSPDGQTLASASWDRTVRLWRVFQP